MPAVPALFAALLLAAAPQPELAIVFEDAVGLQPAAGRLDTGPLAARGKRNASWRSTLRVRLQGATSAKFARLRASLDWDDPRCRVRIDGILLSAAPQMIDAFAPIGRASTHTLEIEVPSGEPPGALISSITWLAETL